MPAAKLTEDVLAKIVAAVSVGARPEQAAQALGIGKRTYYDWTARGRKPGVGDHLYVQLVVEIEMARGTAIVSLIATLRRQANSDWRAVVKLLEMLDRDWARASGQEAGGSQREAPIVHIVIDGQEQTTARAASGDGPRTEADTVAASKGPTTNHGVVIDIGTRRPGADAAGAA